MLDDGISSRRDGLAHKFGMCTENVIIHGFDGNLKEIEATPSEDCRMN